MILTRRNNHLICKVGYYLIINFKQKKPMPLHLKSRIGELAMGKARIYKLLQQAFFKEQKHYRVRTLLESRVFTLNFNIIFMAAHNA